MAKAESKSRPILFSAPMVKALLAGTKTQTRRIIKPRGGASLFSGQWDDGYVLDPGNADWRAQAYPWRAGDTLWVKETWRAHGNYDRRKPSDIPPGSSVYYEADGYAPSDRGKIRVSIFMPRWASRISLRVTDVRVERLQSISEEDAKTEGVTRIGAEFIAKGFTSFDDGPNFYCVETGLGALNSPTAARAYKMLWEHINGAGSWDANPWVVAISFTRILPSQEDGQ